MYLNEKESKLLNKKISKVSMPDDTKLVFELEDGEVVTWDAYGDCCSDTWFETIDGIGYLTLGTVIRIEEKDIPEEVQKALKPTRQEDDQLYGYTLFVEIEYIGESWEQLKRIERVDIEFRNSSNGYYGGSIEETVERQGVERDALLSESTKEEE